MINENLNNINNIMVSAKGNTYDIFLSLYNKYLKNSDSSLEAMRIIVEYSGEVGNADNLSSMIDPQKCQSVELTYRNLLHETIKVLVQRNSTEDVFYNDLYQSVFKSAAFSADDETYAILLKMLTLNTPEIPYLQMKNLLQMSDESFREAIGEILPKINQAVDVFRRHLPTKTEEMSQLWDIANTIETRELQIVYWAVVFDIRTKEKDTREEREKSM